MKFTCRLRHWITGKNLQRGFIGAGHGGGSTTGYQIANSVRLRASANASFSRTPGVAGNSKLLCGRFRIKRGTLGALQVIASAGTSSIDRFYFDSSNRLCLDVLGTTRLVTTAVYRDPSAHYVDVGFQLDVANGTAALRAKILINGTEVGSYSTDTRSSITNTNTNWNAAVVHYIGKDNAGNYFDGVLSEPSLVDGSTSIAYSTTDTNGVPIPSQPSATWGTCGSYLKFNDGTSATTLGYDRSGNGNNWTASGISTTAGVTYDWLTDTPTNNYCVLNAVANFAGSTLSDGNLKLTPAGAGYYCNSATLTVLSGKWYWEMIVSGPNWNAVGVAKVGSSDITTSGRFLGQASDAWSAFVENVSTPLKKYNNSSATAFSPAIGPVAAGDIIQVALDADNGKIFFGYNGTWGDSSDPAAGTNPAFSGLTGPFTPAASASSVSKPLNLNFGQRPFTYTPPTGYKALCTANLPAVAIPNPKKHFDVDTYAGTGASNTRSGFQFQPDFIWNKDRGTIGWHVLVDGVRGVGNLLSSNATNAETSPSYFTSLNSNGYTLSANVVGDAYWTNVSGKTFVNWLWKANGAGVSNTDGSITSTVSANQTAGFSIVTYTGTGANATVGHGLGVAPKMIITKSRNDATYGWTTWHTGIANTEILFLNTTAAKSSAVNAWNSTSPTSTVFSVGTDQHANFSTKTYVAYCFAEIPGYSKFGSYVGNGAADGTNVICGFSPRYVLIKSSTAVDDWRIYDSMRPGYNVIGGTLLADTAGAETTSAEIDFTANGFKLRVATTPNAAQTYIYAAFAAYPFGGSNVSPSCAR